ncbi:FAD-dependent oxidoreductase [Pseudonocardia nantongensis]|uniref:FAD-dependent oxidoreductase n=1 Tax=Pseudonocardia nantongensis TaxID=1181885 RepID=UPI0039794B87
MTPVPRVAVVGGGISGLAATHRLRTRLGPSAEIVVLEQRDRLGGVLHTVDLAGTPFDVGAEAFLVRRPEFTDLLSELGRSDALTHPTAATATIRAGGRTVGLPRGTLMGVPGPDAALDGVLSPGDLARVAAEPSRPLTWEPGSDVALGALLRERFGPEIVDRVADPLLGGVYAGRVDALGLRATAPALAAALDAGAGSLTEAAGAGMAESGQRAGTLAGPVFGAVRGGYRELIAALAAAGGATVRTGVTVRSLHRRSAARGPAAGNGSEGHLRGPRGDEGAPRDTGGWRLELGPASRPEALDVDAVVLAVPAPAARRLLEPVVPAASAAAGRIDLASSAVVGLAYRAADVADMPGTSGCLIAADEPLSAKGVTHASTKWAHLGADGLVRIRASVGRFGEEASLQVDDAELVARVRADLRELDGIAAEPVASVVQRWGGGLPQYGVGHDATVATLEDAVAGVPGLAIAGAMLHGVGVPACVGTARAAADRLAAGVALPARG